MTRMEREEAKRTLEHARQLADTLRFVDHWLKCLPDHKEGAATCRRALRTHEAGRIALGEM